MLIFEKILIFLFLILVGFILTKKSVLDEHTNHKLSTVVLYVANPAMIISASQTDALISGDALLTTILVGVGMFFALILIALALPRIFGLSRGEASAYSIMLVFSNIGYMGIPLVSEVFGAQALLYVSVFIIVFSFAVYTYGVHTLQRGAGIEGRGQKRAITQMLINPGVLSSVAVVVFYLLRVRLPQPVADSLLYLGNLTAPLSMMVIGATLAKVKLKTFFTDYKLLIFSLVKLLVIPVIGGLILKQWISGDLLGVSLVMLSTPVAGMTVMLARQYGSEDALIAKGVALTTLLSILTIPAVFAIVG